MKKLLLMTLVCAGTMLFTSQAQNQNRRQQAPAEEESTGLFPMKGLTTNPPRPENIDKFCKFIEQELAPMGVNTLMIRIDWNYQFKTNPQMAGRRALSEEQIKKMVNVCKKNNIRLVPLVNLLGHQSWGGNPGRLLEVYPELNETPYIPYPDEAGGVVRRRDSLFDGDLYCMSYCPLHPDVHKIVLPLVWEIMDVFEADALHAGMDEVFYIGEYGCPRCSGKDKAELFANEVNLINAYLKSRRAELWIWGDRMLDGKESGLGMYEAATNGTARSIDLIDRDVLICDWHYNRPVPTAAHFAQKGYRVAASPWNWPAVGMETLENIVRFRSFSPRSLRDRYVGIMHTDWSSPEEFMAEYEKIKKGQYPEGRSAAYTFYQMFNKIKEMEAAGEGGMFVNARPGGVPGQ